MRTGFNRTPIGDDAVSWELRHRTWDDPRVVIGASDANGAYPVSDAQTPENFAATIYDALGIPRSAEWHDTTGRPYAVYMADPIRGLRG